MKYNHGCDKILTEKYQLSNFVEVMKAVIQPHIPFYHPFKQLKREGGGKFWTAILDLFGY